MNNKNSPAGSAPPPPVSERVAKLEEALRALNALIVKAQQIVTETLIGQPRGLSDKAGLSALIGLLDGPEQRNAQGRARSILEGQ